MNSKPALSLAPEEVFRIWHYREKIEVEAAQVFFDLGKNMASLWGLHDPVAALAFQAQEDELRHQRLCRDILDHSEISFEHVRLQSDTILGIPGQSLEDRVLYAAVAMGCITETLSTALLMTMYKRAQPDIIKKTVHSILKDEVNHARIGWAELSRASARRDISWLSAHTETMLATALATDINPMVKTKNNDLDLSAYGILNHQEAQAIMKEAIEGTIIPGLEKYGLSFGA